MDELVKALRNCGSGIGLTERCRKCAYYDREWCSGDLCNDAADAIERLVAEVDRKDKAIQGLLTQIESKDKEIERMRYLVHHYKAAYRTAYKPYQEARHEQS